MSPTLRREAGARPRRRSAMSDRSSDVLAQWLPASGLATRNRQRHRRACRSAFAAQFPELDWQPSDPDAAALASIAAWREAGGRQLARTAPARCYFEPLADQASGLDPVHQHGSYQPCGDFLRPSRRRRAAACGRRAADPLRAWIERGVEPAASNLAFDADLKARDPRWGLREVEWFADLAAARGLGLVETAADAVQQFDAAVPSRLTAIRRLEA